MDINAVLVYVYSVVCLAFRRQGFIFRYRKTTMAAGTERR